MVWSLEATLSPPQRKVTVAFIAYQNHRPVIEIGQWPSILVPRISQLCHFFSYNIVEK